MYATSSTIGERGELFPECGKNPHTGIQTYAEVKEELSILQKNKQDKRYRLSFEVKEFNSLAEALDALERYGSLVGNGKGTERGVITRFARSVDEGTPDEHLDQYHELIQKSGNLLGAICRYVMEEATEYGLNKIAKTLSLEPEKERILKQDRILAKLDDLAKYSKKTCETIIARNSSGTAGGSIDSDGLPPQIGRIRQEYKELRIVATAAVKNREYAIEPRKASVLRMLFRNYIDSLEILETHLVKLGYPELEEYTRESAPQNISRIVYELYSLDESFNDVLKTISGVNIKETAVGALIECTVQSGQTFGKSKQKQIGKTMLIELSRDSDVSPPVDVVELYNAIKEEADLTIEALSAEGLLINRDGNEAGNE